MVEKSMILVTWDFTEVSENALAHAQKAAQKLKTNVVLLHIVKKESEIKAAEERLLGVISEKYASYDPKPEMMVKAGTIFTTISEVAEEEGAQMVYMGTHGIKGTQKVFGSWALKVIAHSKVPFIVVQGPPPENFNFSNIVFPVNYRKENRESIKWLHFFSKFFGAKVHIFKAFHTDSGFVKSIDANILFLAMNLKSNGIDYEIIEANKDSDYGEQAISYAKKVNADGVFVMTTKDIGITDYMLGAHEQYIIANKYDIPVICANPKPPKFGGSFSTSGS